MRCQGTRAGPTRRGERCSGEAEEKVNVGWQLLNLCAECLHAMSSLDARLQGDPAPTPARKRHR